MPLFVCDRCNCVTRQHGDVGLLATGPQSSPRPTCGASGSATATWSSPACS
jgi:hypothetical protein